MKKLVLPLALLSLALNAAFGLLLVRGLSSPADPGLTAPAAAAAKEVAPAAGEAAVDADTWPKLEAGGDLPTLVANLRAAGFPPDVVRAIVYAQVGEQFAARRKALIPESNVFWKNRVLDPKTEAARRDLAREERALMRTLLGADADSNDPMNLAWRNRGLTHLAGPKADEVRDIMRDFDERRREMFNESTSMVLDIDQMRSLEDAQRAAIAKVLTPQEMEEYELRTSRTATGLRSELSVFNPTEEEFRAIYRLKKPFDDQYSALSSPSPEVSRQRQNAQKLLVEQIKASLSPERAAEYDRATDYNYRQTSQLVGRLELPPETAGQVYAVQKELQIRAQQAYGMPREQRTAELAAITEEAKNRVSSLIGSRGFEAYKSYGGSWMQMLQPPRTVPGEAGPAVISITPR